MFDQRPGIRLDLCMLKCIWVDFDSPGSSYERDMGPKTIAHQILRAKPESGKKTAREIIPHIWREIWIHISTWVIRINSEAYISYKLNQLSLKIAAFSTSPAHGSVVGVLLGCPRSWPFWRDRSCRLSAQKEDWSCRFFSFIEITDALTKEV